MTGAGVNRTRIITLTGILMAMDIVLSSFGIPVPGGHLYLNDIIICAAALILGPFPAFMVGGVGAFIGDMLFYPAPMFVSLATHGLQAVVISLISHKLFQKKQLVSDITAVSVGAVIMVVGYTLGRAYVYSTPEYAMVKLPYQIIQAVVGAIFGVFLCNSLNLRKMAFKQ